MKMAAPVSEKADGCTHRRRHHAAVFKLLKCGSRSLRSLDELELRLAPVDTMWFRHIDGARRTIGTPMDGIDTFFADRLDVLQGGTCLYGN